MSAVFDLADLARPVLAAPMAGGPSTPALVQATTEAGGLGQLAAGYLTPGRLRDDIAEVRALGSTTFGVNLFVPEHRGVDRAAVLAYRERLVALAGELGVELPTDLGDDDDHFAAKVDLVLAESVPVVSFTFGCPTRDVVDALHGRGSSVGVAVTSVPEAVAAAQAGVDWLCVQGPEAGGHRATFDRDLDPPVDSLATLLDQVGHAVTLPLVAAGGIMTRDQADRFRAAGARAVQVGTALLRTHEAGTKPVHAEALADPQRTRTLVTRCFSGRPARALANRFTDRFDAVAPPEFPAVHWLTAGLRRAAGADPEAINLWAGTGFRAAAVEPVGQVVERLG